MSAYHQMGHDSENLLFESDLGAFAGSILSPVNYDPAQTTEQVARVAKDLSPDFRMLLDPQMYVARSERGRLRDWSYFPRDVDSADISSMKWWTSINDSLVADALACGIDGVMSPVSLPKGDSFTNDYLAFTVQVGNDLVEKASDSLLSTQQTAVIAMRELAAPDRALEIASLLSASTADGIYLVFKTDLAARRELSQTDQLMGAARLIKELRKADVNVLVGCCAGDMVLWKHAGASSCATGKFFNLRRFTPGRWEAAGDDGGQNIAYLFEESLLAFIRQTDIVRLNAAGLLSAATLANPFAQQIIRALASSPTTAWVGKGWRQYMHWFADCEARLTNGLSALELLKNAETGWRKIEDVGILLDEARNDGAWVRPWRIAANEIGA
jgi:hypothetical protein